MQTSIQTDTTVSKYREKEIYDTFMPIQILIHL